MKTSDRKRRHHPKMVKIYFFFRTLFRLFQHPSLTIVKGAGLIMKALIEEGEQEIGIKMQGLALAEGNYIIHLIINITYFKIYDLEQ